MRRRGLSAERLALVKRYADALWHDLPDFKLAPAWALRPWLTDEDSDGLHDDVVAHGV